LPFNTFRDFFLSSDVTIFFPPFLQSRRLTLLRANEGLLSN
jgi:hypothetical protein